MLTLGRHREIIERHKTSRRHNAAKCYKPFKALLSKSCVMQGQQKGFGDYARPLMSARVAASGTV